MFIAEDCQPVRKAIDAAVWDAFEKAFRDMVDAANSYHELYDKSFLRWKIPETRPRDLDVSPRR